MAKILVVCGAGIVSGKEIITLNLIKGLKERGHCLMCITSDWGSQEFKNELEQLEVSYKSIRIGFISKTLTLSAIRMTLHQIVYLPKLWWDFNNIKADYSPDVILHTNFHHLTLLFPFIREQKNIYHAHESYENTAFYRFLFKILSKKVNLFIGVSKAVSQRLIRLGIHELKVKTIYNGLDFDITVESKKTDGVVTIGIAGQIGSWKGHEDLINALHLLNQKHLPFICNIYGDGDKKYIQKLCLLISKLDLQERIFFKGFIKSKVDIYGSVDIICIPSRNNDPLPTTAIEASYFKIPLLCTPNGGLREIVADGINGFIIPSENPHEFSEKLEKLILNSHIRKTLGENAYAIAIKKFSSKSMLDKFEEAFNRS